MPFHAQCPGCLTSAYLDCGCPPGFDPAAAGVHVAACPLFDPDAAVVCPDPQRTGCCPEQHDHAAAAAACPGGHSDCTLGQCAVLTPVGEPCPGGHCGKGIDGCAVCRPLIITAMPGSARLVPATGG